ncbi:hypothetical protein A9P82_12895 [Arachidicoccus ginsenosidimutans]|uniref:hypothetical protein n=1 Tax=Arachidicoccus sp. BS20 TaxID=1850526 RepID=UPI0007F0B9DA|nr:hypothetical protein [Arachidicoccus sp. BS20]ANI90101.1 hypothetical protein A9P82_12895 [Arachidicoccus sp. BS20]
MLKKYIYITCCLLVCTLSLKAQIKITGKIYTNDSTLQPAKNVEVSTSAANATYSDELGNYSILISQSDTLKFSQDGVLIASYPFLFIPSFTHFDIYLNVAKMMNMGHDLGTVNVHAHNYSQDSLDTRRKYGDIFNYKKPKISTGNHKWKEHTTFMGQDVPINTSGKPATLLDVGSLADALNFKKKKQMEFYRKSAVANEQSNYIQHRFNKTVIEKYTAIHDDDSLNTFIKKYSPSYEELQKMNDLDLGMYIINKADEYRKEEKKE